MPVGERSSPAQFAKEEFMEQLNAEESPTCAHWNPRLLINKLYEVSYEPRKESKLNRFVNMEGHLEVPVDDDNVIAAELQKKWTQKYFRTKEGRLQWFASHFADEHPVGEVSLSGCEIEARKDEGLLIVNGDKENFKVILKVSPPGNIYDKWRRALNSHTGSKYTDAFMHPISPPVQLSTKPVFIFELGSCSIRAGVLTKEPSLPQCFFPSIAVKKKDGSIIVGIDALSPENRHDGELVRPIQPTDPAFERLVLDEDVLKCCLEKCTQHLRVDPTKYRVIFLNSLLQIKIFISAVFSHPSLILHAYDVTTGAVVDIGDKLSIVPVVDGYIVENAVITLPYGALQIANALKKKLLEANMSPYSFKSPVERLILRYVMEQSCYVSVDFEQERKQDVDLTVSLDEFQLLPEMASTFKVDSARFTAPEGLFKPKRWDLDSKGLHELVNEAIQLSPIDNRKTLFRNIYLAGGASLLPGLAERLEAEISTLVPCHFYSRVHVSPWRYHAAYLGAQELASSVQFEDRCITKEKLPSFLDSLQNATF
ncbi:unnamed protein product [Enterobius vermicularis]|uniref:PH domain-containing protein n=1 Tax=Enterobius vermicularis TaxID=51028 RepID=A0A0N4VJE7_ENTVE|nr:unnamed protein product [Enterobius vermicularis]